MKTKFIYLVLLIALIFPTFSFFLGDKMYTFSDETQIANFHQYFKSMDLGQFPPRWASDMHYEYGSPFLQFNYQLPYYLGYLGHLINLPITTIFKLLMAISLVAGAVGMFALGQTLTGSAFFSLAAAVLYTYTPYQAIDRYVRGAIGESFALSLLPWLFLAGVKLTRKVNTVGIVILGILIGLLLISHQPAALFTIPLFAFIFGLSLLLSRKVDILIGFVKSTIVGLLLSAYYWIPVIFERTYIQVASPFNYRDQFPFIWQLIYSPWKYSGASPFSTDTFSFQIGIINLLVLLFASVMITISFIRRQKGSVEVWLTRLLVISTFLVIGLMNIRSDPIWKTIPIIQVIQFPWRLLMFTSIFTSILFLFVIKTVNKPWDKVVALIVVLAAIALNVSYFRPGLIVDHDDGYYLHRFLPRAALLPGEKISAEYFNHAEDYVPLPKEATRPFNLPESKLTTFDPVTTIKNIDPNPYSFRAEVTAVGDDVLTFHTFNYPGWEVRVDGFLVPVTPNTIGAISFPVPPGRHEVSLSFKDTRLRLFSNIISLGSLSFIGSYLIYQLVNRRVTSTTRGSKSR